MRKLYFCKVELLGECIYAGHWYAVDAEWARSELEKEFQKSATLWGKDEHAIITDEYKFIVRRSNAHANALNLP